MKDEGSAKISCSLLIRRTAPPHIRQSGRTIFCYPLFKLLSPVIRIQVFSNSSPRPIAISIIRGTTGLKRWKMVIEWQEYQQRHFSKIFCFSCLKITTLESHFTFSLKCPSKLHPKFITQLPPPVNGCTGEII